MSYVQNTDFSKAIYECHQLQTRLKLSCIKGFVAGLMEGGQPGTEFVNVISFCKNSSLTIEEKKACFEETSWLSYNYYPKEKRLLVCTMVDDQYKSYCNSF